jgi:hypothetical protein
MPPNLAHAHLHPTGDRLLTPPLDEGGARIVLEGVFTFRYSGLQFDALYQTGPEGDFTRPHPYLQWSPRVPLLESEDRARHRYEFRVPAGWRLGGQSLGLRVDVDRFVEQFLLPPSEVRAALTGEMTVRVLPPPPTTLWPVLAAAGLPATLVAGGLGWVLHRRMALQGLPPELQLRLERINRKVRAARAASRSLRSSRLGESLRALHHGAWALARQFRALQQALSRVDGLALQVEAERLEQALPRMREAGAQVAGQAVLAEKRKALVLLHELDHAQTRSAMRLAAIEATLDTTLLTLQQPPAGTCGPFEPTVLRDLEAEVMAIAEVAREIESAEGRPSEVLPPTAMR